MAIDLMDRTVSDKLDVKGKEISRIILWYLDDEIWVNRKYQRKLVWSLEEKQLFIDSIISKIPTPSMILASYDIGDEHRYEIIDGLQRINAIISFVLGEFPVLYKGEERYFDLSTSYTSRLLRSGVLSQPEPVLPEKVCHRFTEYELPLVLTEQSSEKIELIFNRINSSGKKLSAQDLRQSGSCDHFADLVRRISCFARGEFSFDDFVNLSDMPKISISGDGLNYKIDCNNIFWRRHDIITYDNIRQSRDEELIAQILGEVLLTGMKNPSHKILNQMYQADDSYNVELNNRIDEVGMEYLEERVRGVFDTIEMIFGAVDSNFSSWVFEERKTRNKNDFFRIFFISIYRLFSKGYFIADYQAFAEGIRRLSGYTMGQMMDAGFITKKMWDSVSATVYRFMEPLMTKSLERIVTEEEKEIKYRLSKSSIESQMTEYKIGIAHFDNGFIKDETIHRIGRTLSAMANTESKEVGYVIIGIADSPNSGKDWEKSYDTKALICNGHYVTGVEEEAVRYFHGTDNYLNCIGKCLEKEPFDSDLKDYVLENYQEIDFDNRKLILIPSKNVGHIVKYDGIVYVRNGNSTIVKRPD